MRKKDFDALALSMDINTHVLESIYTKFKIILPNWINFIKQRFLSKSMQKSYLEFIQDKFQHLFQ